SVTGVQALYDRNGRSIEMGQNINGHPDFSMTDGYQRFIRQQHQSVWDTATQQWWPQDVITAKGAQGAALTWTINWRTVAVGGLQYKCKTQPTIGYCYIPSDLSVISEIVLPNGLKYLFSYGGKFGELTQVTLPTGAVIAYHFVLDS